MPGVADCVKQKKNRTKRILAINTLLLFVICNIKQEISERWHGREMIGRIDDFVVVDARSSVSARQMIADIKPEGRAGWQNFFVKSLA